MDTPCLDRVDADPCSAPDGERCVGMDRVTLRERVLLELARREKSDQSSTFKAITEAAAVALDIARVSIWQLVDHGARDRERIVCKDLYLRDEKAHASFAPLYETDYPAYFEALNGRRTISASDARNDPRTAEFTERYLKPLGITSMLDTPIWHRGELYGVLCFEQIGPARRWRADEQAFAINLADIASSCLEAADHVADTRRWETMIASLSEGVALVDPEGTLVQCNRAMQAKFFDAVGARTLAELLDAIELVDASDAPVPHADRPLQRVLRRERVDGEIFGLVFKRTGERRYARVTGCPIVERGELTYAAFVVADVTDEVRVERLKSELLSGVAHELKTPLAIAKGYAQQLARTKTSPERGDRMLEAIVHACDRLDHLSGTLLDLGGVMLGRLRLTRERVDLAELVLSCVRSVERAARDHAFDVKLRPNVFVTVDSARVSEALRHVLENAVAYSAPGSAIEVALCVGESSVTVSVRDHGIGIAPDAQATVFCLFSKAHAGTVHDRGGLGVGLFLAREIVRRHGGDMWFESEQGTGSTFYFSLPLARCP